MYQSPQPTASFGLGGTPSSTAIKTSKSGAGSSVPPVKPKQSKSRNGCVTCKAKRLKCDETKPTCLQCHKRGVPCGGYKKDFKWRPFEESTIAGRVSKASKKGVQRSKKSTSPTRLSDQSDVSQIQRMQMRPVQYPSLAANDMFNLDSLYIIPNDVLSQLPSPPPTAALPTNAGVLGPTDLFGNGSLDGASGPPRGELDVPLLHITRIKREPETGLIQDLLDFVEKQPGMYFSGDTTQTLSMIGSSAEVFEDDIEEIIRSGSSQCNSLVPSPATSTISVCSSSSSSASQSSQGENFVSILDIFRRPPVTVESPEVLLSYFDKNTCGIMSVKDGPTENPWRTLIWPLAHDSLALYHAISSMTAFHMSKQRPQLRVEGMEHMRKSIRFLTQGLSHGNIGEDAALGTTLVLAFSEAFDKHISTGVEHLRGARVLLNQSLAKISSLNVNTMEFQRLQFLNNVWVYLDVLAGLTSDADEGDGMNPVMLSYSPLIPSFEVDPLLGCAATLFPLIGEAASLVQRVRKSEENSVGIITAAMDLKARLESWQTQEFYAPIEDPSSDVIHCVTTAEAYRWATLLYLHQAVPELPSPSAHVLANKVMRLIASISQDSRACIIHIYPLLAAGCEAVGEEERNWVRERWEGMLNRMWIGNVDKAWQVVKEVWHRRDSFRMRQNAMTPPPPPPPPPPSTCSSLSSPGSGYGSPQQQDIEHHHRGRKQFSPINDGDTAATNSINSWDDLENSSRWRSQRTRRSGASEMLHDYHRGEWNYEVSIRGSLHWLGVMKFWKWEVLLG